MRHFMALLALACAVAAFHLDAVAEGRASQSTERPQSNYDAEIEKLRALTGDPATRDQAMEQLGALAVRAALELEGALVLGDSDRAQALERLIEEKFGDTRGQVERRAEGGDADALFALGMFQARNLLGAGSEEGACSFFIRAAERNHVPATYRAAICVLQKDPERSAKWMQLAADAGHPAAQEAVGRACLEHRPVPRLDCAARNVSAAARAGRPSAQSLLGWMTANGAGVPKDPRRAATLYLEAARKFDAAAQNNLGELYENGVGVAQNKRLAAGWYRTAAQADFPPAQFNLGRLYALGIGVKQDPVQARLWLDKAKAQGISQADDVLRWLDAQAGDKAKK